MLKLLESRKVVTRAATLILLIASVAVLSHLFKSTRELHASENSKASADAAEAALQFKQSFAAYSPAPDDAFPTPDGWKKLASVDPNLDFARELEFISLHARDNFPVPFGWEKVSSAAPRQAEETPQPSFPPLALPPIAADLPAETKPAAVAEKSSSAPVSIVGSSSSSDRFPTEQRVWTNYNGSLTVASVIKCNFHTGELLMESEGGILRTYQLTRLSDADRDYLWSLANEEK